MDSLSAALWLISLILIVVFLLLIWIVVVITLVHRKYCHIPGPQKSSFFFGNTGQIVSLTRQGKDAFVLPADRGRIKPLFHELLVEWGKEYGDVYVIFMLHRPLVIVQSPASVKTVLVHADKLFEHTTIIPFHTLFGQRLVGDCIFLLSDYDKWIARRKFMDPLFQRSHLQNQIESMNLVGDELIDELVPYIESGESVVLGDLFRKINLDGVMRIIFSMKSAELENEFHQLAYTFVTQISEGLQMSQIPFFEWNPLNCGFREDLRQVTVRMRNVAAKSIQERITIIQTDDDAPNDMLTAMVKSYLNDENIYPNFETMVDEFVNIIAAGMDTTANTMEYIFMELSRHPQVLSRLKSEVDEVVGRKSEITCDDITKLHFLSMVIKETLRLHPQTGMFKKALRDTELDGYFIPAGTTVMVNSFAANRNEKFIDEPLRFNPSRYDQGQGHKHIPLYSNIPFSLGKRNCIGQVLAQMDMKIFTAKFFQNFDFHIDQSETYYDGLKVFPHPISGVKCTITPRA